MINDKGSCRIDRLPCRCTLELACSAWPARGISDTQWPSAPGGVQYDPQQRPALLHFAPGRWLAPDPTEATRSLLAGAAQAAAGAWVDVTGKWDALLISGPDAPQLLACAIAIEPVLHGRDCAAVTLFDCPAILARTQRGFALWVQSSYTTDFVTTAEHFCKSLEARR